MISGGVLAIYGPILSNRKMDRDEAKLSDLKSENSRLAADLEQIKDSVANSAKRRVFLVLAAPSEEWQMEFQKSLLAALSSYQLRHFTFMPTVTYDPGQQDRFFVELIRERREYAGGLVLPVYPERRHKQLFDFANKIGLPVVYIDNNPGKAENMPKNTAYVGVTAAASGEMAALALDDYIQTSGDIKRVLVLAGLTQKDRQNVFKDIVVAKYPSIKLDIDESCDFIRNTARGVATGWLDRSISRKDPIDVIFCTTDSIALGCLDAIKDVYRRSSSARPKVIGHDGVPDMRTLVSSDSSPAIRVVLQDTDDIATQAVRTLVAMINGEPFEQINTVDPRLYPTTWSG